MADCKSGLLRIVSCSVEKLHGTFESLEYGHFISQYDGKKPHWFTWIFTLEHPGLLSSCGNIFGLR